MGVRNRNQYANRRSANANGGGYVRGAFAVLCLVALSFALGFFVLARLLPDDHAAKAGTDSAASAKSMSEEPVAASAADRKPAPAPRKIAAAPAAPATPKQDDGPLIEANDATPEPTASDAARPAPNIARAPTPAAPQDNANPNVPVQTPRQPDGGTPAAPTADPPTALKRYHVQINLHETRESAEQEAQQIIERGFKARVRPVIREGRPLFRVEYSIVYKHKLNADAMLTKLREAGIDSAIITEQ